MDTLNKKEAAAEKKRILAQAAVARKDLPPIPPGKKQGTKKGGHGYNRVKDKNRIKKEVQNG